MSTALECPKCRDAMRTYERSGIGVDQCTECRGIFLDRGELERLLDAETAGGSQAPDERVARRRVGASDDDQYRDHDERGRGDGERDHHRAPERPGLDPRGQARRRESRFGGLLDLFGDEE